MNKSFSLFELILVILLLLLIFSEFKINHKNDKLDIAAKRLVMYLKHTRYQSLIDNKYDSNDNLWYMKRWTLKFLRCKNNEGIYYSIYSDENKTGQIAKDETLKDPLSNKYIYSSNQCEENSTNSKYVLLSKNFNVKEVVLSCNSTSSLGQISFGANGKIYTKLSKTQNNSEENVLADTCELSLKDEFSEKKIFIEANGYIYLAE